MKKKFAYLLAIPIIVLGIMGTKYYQKSIYRPRLTVIGLVNMSDGIGRQSVEILDALKDEVSVRFKSNRPDHENNYKDVPPAIMALIKKRQARLGDIVIYEDIIYPNSHLFFQKRFNSHEHDQIRFAYSMFESSEIPRRWVENFNLYFDAVLVPDPFLVKVYEDSGVKIPIFVLPLGLNLKPFLTAPIKQSAHTPFVFANFSTCILRKNHADLIHAFHKAFGNDPNVCLWINSKYTEDNLLEHLQQEIDRLEITNITLTNHCFSHAEYLDNFQKIDCYVTLAKSEGFSIQPREAMALGIPCIVSDNTAQSTICSSGFVTSVPCPTTESAYYEIFREAFGVRYIVDFNAAVKALQEVYSNYPQHLQQSLAGRSWVRQYDYSQLRPLYKSLVKPKNIILGDANRIHEDCIITNSLDLYKKYLIIQ